jgi:methylthioribose-1-phosphate isomerase
MRVQGEAYRTIWPRADGAAATIIDQTKLPHAFVTADLTTIDDAEHAIRAMRVRGAPLIGATAAFGVWLAMRRDPGDGALEAAHRLLLAARPTAVNLRWALADMRATLGPLAPSAQIGRAHV